MIGKVKHVDQQILDILKARSYHGLGYVAQEQRQWEEAEQYYKQALQIYIKNNDLSNQAPIYHQLGMVTSEQHQWQQAEAYHQQALQLLKDFNDRYNQARPYHQLGRVAQEQRQWKEASKFFLQSLEIDATYHDTYNMRIYLRSLARLWKASDDASLPATVATILGYDIEETEKLLRDILGEE